MNATNGQAQAAHVPDHEHFHPLRIYRHHMANTRQERAFLHATGYTLGTVGCRVTTHAIRSGRGPFRNMSVGGRHLHHCTFGIVGQILIGYVWTYQLALGENPERRAGSRVTAFTSGVATALTLDEFALWFNLQDDYWTPAGRESVDMMLLFGGVSVMGLSGRELIRELARAATGTVRRVRRESLGR